MAAAPAFRGSVRKRDELLSDIRANGALTRIWLNSAAIEERFAVIVQEYVLDPVLVRLIAALSDMATSPARTEFVATVIEALPLDKPTGGIACAWLIDRWESTLATRLEGSAVHEPARTVVQLVKDSQVGEVPAEAWRAAIRGLALAAEPGPDIADYVEVVEAMAWDTSKAPGAITDVIQAWCSAARRDALRAAGWTDALEQEYTRLARDYQTRIAPEMRALDTTDRVEIERIFEELMRKQFDGEGRIDLMGHAMAAHKASHAGVQRWGDEQRESLCAFLTSSAQDIKRPD
ncbi:hypothetical protein SAMN05518801_10220 [Novosphingobium sp. CF614]|uniref:hypothetical protein n=1 Tax=Novosphingobium sp. CF614 TaxID=1884364 RepID=UPI0008F32B28|nr:hypothetical protein [Novosphingobium sp. CF614]SFF82497.1 hypothetical protein SAMN05518801_10220 [Novosphingobium sp. CF614]